MNPDRTTRSRAPRRAALLIAAVVAALGLPLLVSAPAQAADNGTWSVYPTQIKGVDARTAFFFEATAGQVVKDSVTVQNTSKLPITFTLYPADAFNAAGGGGFALREFGKPNKDLGTWVKLSKNQVSVPAKASANVPFTMTVPRNASPGDHVGGIVALNAATEQVQQPNGVAVGVRRAVGTRIYTRVAGAITTSMVVSDVTLDIQDKAMVPIVGKGKGTITYTIRNTGNTRIQPTTVISVDGIFGRSLLALPPKPLPEILPGESITSIETWDEVPALDQVHVRVDAAAAEKVASGGEKQTTAGGDTTVWLVPWPFVIGLALVLLLILVGRRYLSRGQAGDEGTTSNASAPFPSMVPMSAPPGSPGSAEPGSSGRRAKGRHSGGE